MNRKILVAIFFLIAFLGLVCAWHTELLVRDESRIRDLENRVRLNEIRK